jgi:thiamine-monophosphate kinase
MTILSDIGEFKLINIISKMCKKKGNVIGIGDDAAAFRNKNEMVLVSTDMFIEDVHFNLNFISGFDLGWRVMAAGISDIAAIGGIPKYAFCSIGIPAKINVKFVTDFYRGMNKCSSMFNVYILGGDTVNSKKVVIDIIIVGSQKRKNLKLRSNAKVNDIIFVTGKLGTAALGLEMLKGRIKKEKNCIKKFLNPIPRVKESKILSKLSYVHAMIDTSDGLSSDIRHILDMSGVGAEIYEDSIPIADVPFLERKVRIKFALCGGEDYELLFTASYKSDKIMKIATPIGRIVKGNSLKIIVDGKKKELKEVGYEHFR